MIAMRGKIKIFGPHPQEGAALIIAVLILLILTVIGIYAVTTSIFETKISGFERAFKEAFYVADSGEPMGIELTKIIIHELPAALSDLPDDPWKDSGVIDIDLFSEIFTDERNPDTPEDSPPDINSKGIGSNLGLPSRVQLRVDIDRINAYQITGGAQQFASGYEGIGGGGGGSVGINYAIDSLGQFPLMQSESRIEAGYLHVIGVAGGE